MTKRRKPLTIERVAERIGHTLGTTRHLASRRILPPYDHKIGGKHVWRARDIDDYLKLFGRFKRRTKRRRKVRRR